MTDRELMQQALEALEKLTIYDSRSSSIWRYFYPSATGDYVNLREFKELSEPIVNALRAALAQPEQEPFEYWNAVEGWVKIDEVRKHFDSVGCGTIYKTAGEDRVPLYTSPPQRNPLTEEDARLIAAAPDLLAALQGLLRGIFDGPDEANAAMLVAKARDAINKATEGEK